MTEHVFSRLLGTKDNESETYILEGLPPGENFKNPDNYVQLEATWLKVEGIGFSASGFEFSQADRQVIVYQDTEGGSARIQFD